MTIKNKIRTALRNCESWQHSNEICYFCPDDLSEIAAEIRSKKIRECRIDKVQLGYQVTIRGAWLVGWLE